MARWSRTLTGVGIRISEQPGSKSLVLELGAKSVVTTNRIPHPFVEASYTCAIKIELAGIGADGIVCGLSNLEALTVNIDLAAIDAVFLSRK